MAITPIWAIIYLITKYNETVTVEETTTTMPIPILLLIAVFIAVIVIGGAIIMILTWWEQIKSDRFSFYTFAPILLLILGVTLLARLLIDKLYVLIQMNTAQFLIDLMQYRESVMTVLWIVLSGIIVGALGKAWEYISQVTTT